MDITQAIFGALLAVCGALYLFLPDRHFHSGRDRRRGPSRMLRNVIGGLMSVIGLLQILAGLA